MTVRYRMLGTLDLEGSREAALRQLLVHPKRLALLAYLAVQPPRGFHRRDSIAAVFWPERDAEHARAALRQALFELRQALGDDVVIGRSSEDVGLATDRFICDVWEFEDALKAGELQRAVESYGGPLLNGVHVSEGGEFERWLEGERNRLAGAYAAALERLAEGEWATGDHGKGLEWWERLAQHDPHNSRVAMQLARTLAAARDRANAVQYLERHVARLRGDLGVEPDAELVELIDWLKHEAAAERWAASSVSADAPASVGGGAEVVTDGKSAPVSSRAWRSWRSRGALVGSALAAAAIGWVLRPSDPVTLDPDLIAVVPFEVVDPDMDKTWSEGIARLIAVRVDGAGPFRSAPTAATVTRWRGGGDEEHMTDVARTTGAGLVIIGELVYAGSDSTRAHGVLFDASARRTVAELEVRDRRERTDRLADSLALGIMRALASDRPIGPWRLSSVGSSSLPAVRAFLKGEHHFRRFWLDSAVFYYRQAIEYDSTFALAFSGLAASRLSHSFGLRTDLFLSAGAMNHGLAPRESLLLAVDSVRGAIRSHVWYRKPDSLLWRLQTTLEEAGRRYPHDPQVWFRFGDELYHSSIVPSPMFSLDRMREVRGAMAQAVALDSAFAAPYVHLVQLDLILDGVPAARRDVDAFLALPTGGVWWETFHVLRDILDTTRWNEHDLDRYLDSVAAELPTRYQPRPMDRTNLALQLAILQLWWLNDSTEVAVRLARHTPNERTYLWSLLGYRGHLRELQQRIRADSAPGWPEVKNRLHADMARLGAIPRDTLREILDGWFESESAYLVYHVLPAWMSLRDTTTLRRVVEFFEPMGSEPQGRNNAPPDYVAHAARGYLQLAQGDTAAALETLAAREPWCEWYHCHNELLAVAEIHTAAGRYQEASAQFDAMPTALDIIPSPGSVYLALARARVVEQLGDHAEAARLYRFVADAWQNADPELDRYVEEARNGLTRLRLASN